jgi:hypothetical protein
MKPSDDQHYVTIECGFCGKKGGAYLRRYELMRCACGKMFWALRPVQSGPLIAFPWPGRTLPFMNWNTYPGAAPPKLQRVLVFTNQKYSPINIALHNGIQWFSDRGHELTGMGFTSKVLAWQPLPDPPKENPSTTTGP